jgi:uncharacterized protein YbaR (Trm112 family)
MSAYGEGVGRGPDKARRLVQKFSGPMATIYACPYCKHFLKVRKNTRGTGRGYGLREGGTAHSQMGKHIREIHAELIA